MPTAAKLISGVAFLIVGYLAALAYIPQLPEGTKTAFFPELTAALGFLVGWRSLGLVVGKGYAESLSYGLRASIILVFSALLVFSVYHMIQQAFKVGHYHDAGEAVLDVPMTMLDYGKLLWAPQVIEVLVIGGVLGGLVAEFVDKRWR